VIFVDFIDVAKEIPIEGKACVGYENYYMCMNITSNKIYSSNYDEINKLRLAASL
jgi:hypothetical protein